MPNSSRVSWAETRSIHFTLYAVCTMLLTEEQPETVLGIVTQRPTQSQLLSVVVFL